MSKRKDYSSYRVEDLLSDESFQDWVLHPASETPMGILWKKLSAQQTPLAGYIREAVNLIQGLRFKEEFPSEATQKAALDKSLQQIAAVQIETEKEIEPAANLGRHKRLIMHSSKNITRLVLRAAACIALFLGAYYSYRYIRQSGSITIQTAYAQTKTLLLPDSSMVILNAHSTLTYPKHWRKDKTRELTLIGEAYFKVRHLNQDPQDIRPGERFIVHSGQMDIEVLGTSFDVKQQGPIASVLLAQGSIRLTLKQLGMKFNLQPCDRITYDASNRQYNRTKVDPTGYISWTNHEILLKDKSLQQISQLLSEYYGLQIKLQNPGLAEMKMEGTLLLDSLPDVLFALSTAMHLEIERHDDTLIFRKKTP